MFCTHDIKTRDNTAINIAVHYAVCKRKFKFFPLVEMKISIRKWISIASLSFFLFCLFTFASHRVHFQFLFFSTFLLYRPKTWTNKYTSVTSFSCGESSMFFFFDEQTSKKNKHMCERPRVTHLLCSNFFLKLSCSRRRRFIFKVASHFSDCAACSVATTTIRFSEFVWTNDHAIRFTMIQCIASV